MKGLCVIVDNCEYHKHGLTQGMMLFAQIEDDYQFLRPPEGTTVGERITIEGSDDIDTETRERKLDDTGFIRKCLQKLQTDDNCNAVWDGKKLKVKTGYITADKFKNAPIS